ncbi:tRNA wybutosine-synthesizing protein 2/3/4 [Ananas comosus]|uniref:tRNA wybutosine-synthesizing protein 2/3/4 n=1 Tax=Ananas comosus TaxID=4615 RepID=A0A199UH21_ANACO|nr:tRNA wybutosine-synthesizing protein 2/3/4 [Ananas comosus]
MVAIRCSIRLEVPLGQLGSLVVSPEYVRYLVQIANDKMEANKKRTDGFLALLQSKGLPESTTKMPDMNTACATQSVKGGSASTRYSGDYRDDGLFCKNALRESNCLDDGEVACSEVDRSHVSESSDIHNCSLEVALLKIVDKPVEKLFLWGQSACVLNNREKQVLIFGGFGGLGRHARRNYTLALDAQSGLLREMDAKGLPTPRLGHSAAVIGTNMYVIGGRTGPSQVLNDVWVLQTTESRWSQLECTGDSFNPRHRHAAVAVGSNIYVFGGLSNEVIYSSMTVLNTETLHWSEIPVEGHDGEKALSDLYSFDITTQQWKIERWEHLGDIVVLPKTSFRDPLWDSMGDELWPLVAKSLGAQRLARQGRILPTGTRDSTLELLVGDNGWVTHHENGILYSFDATKCMFSSGNRSEKLRMARLYCENETVVDLFAGIGYFVLPFLVKANAKFVYACEWNPHALAALKHNIHANSVADRCVILEGDNRLTAPQGVADRVCLGLLPSSECSWATAVRALRAVGGVLHIHGNVNDSEENSWLDYVVQSIQSISESEGLSWDISIEHVERIKWYGPHIRHLVADVRCKQL